MSQPLIIQGGMGVAVSSWPLARAVSCLGQLGVVSGTALAVVLARRLQMGDLDGQIRNALSHFPVPEIAARIEADYFIPGGKAANVMFKLSPMPSLHPGKALEELTVAGSFVEVFLSKQGHDGLVGINFLEKIQLPNLASLFGAMLADVDYVLMGAGIPRHVPGAIDRLAAGEPTELKMDVEGSLPDEDFFSSFNPKTFGNGSWTLKRPQFLGIVASATLAMTLARKSNGRVDGFIVEGETAGGHNAPPRGPMHLNALGEPIYGPRDVPDLEKIRNLGLPFWLAGSFGRPDKLAEALRSGAAGVQVGTAFAFCEESSIRPDLKRRAIEIIRQGKARVFTDPVASPTGFPFKVAQIDGTLSDASLHSARKRICDLGYLRHLYRKADGTVGYRCPAEPVENYLKKGGQISDTVGRNCVCNGLSATVGLSQFRGESGYEPALVTAGNDFELLTRFIKPGADSYTAADVIQCLLEKKV